MGRDTKYASELTDEIVANADKTIAAWNFMLTHYYAENPTAARVVVRSGWRPPEVNDATSNSAPHSKHLAALAMDGSDSQRSLAYWLASKTEQELAVFGLWYERPEATQTWVHGQCVPPASGNRFFWPTTQARNDFVASGDSPIIT
jgi:hypothetical protein